MTKDKDRLDKATHVAKEVKGGVDAPLVLFDSIYSPKLRLEVSRWIQSKDIDWLNSVN